MTERPILMNADMVRAVLDGRKTQTRRPVKPQPYIIFWRDAYDNADEALFWRYAEPREDWPYPRFCPFGQIGDRLWVRETWQDTRSPGEQENRRQIMYRADDDRSLIGWRPSIHMPRWAARIILEITDVRVERVQDITEAAAKAEGVPPAWLDVNGQDVNANAAPTFRQGFARTWNEIYAKKGPAWSTNPWVWVVEFRRVEA